VELHAWESVTSLIIESTQVDGSEGLEATPLEKDIQAAEEASVWRGKVRGMQENSRFWIPYHRNTLVWAFFRLIARSADVHIQKTQVMLWMICHPMASLASISPPSTRNIRHKR
jgi:hypothetical protein